MGLLRAIAAPERRSLVDMSGVPLTGANLVAAFAGLPTATGQNVTPDSALKIGTVLACTRVLAESVAGLPLPLYRRLNPRGKERAPDHPLYRLLHDRPNPWMTSFTLREALMGHLCLWGNAFAEIMRDGSGRVTGLFPLRPDRMQRPVLNAAGGLIYRYSLPGGKVVDMADASVLHLRGLSSDGLWGYSPISLQREALGLALTAEEFQARFFGNDASPSGVLQVKGKLSEPAAQNLSKSWQQNHEGLQNAHRLAILEEGVEWKQIGMPLHDAQFLQLRSYQRSEIASWFRVPPHMIGDVEKSTSWGTGIEQQTIGFIVYTLRPWLVNIEQQISVDLLSEQDQKQYFAEHLIDGLMRGDSAARQAFYTAMLDRGVFSINDVLEMENRNPTEGGDERFVQANMQTLTNALKAPALAPPASAPDEPQQNALPDDDWEESDVDDDEEDRHGTKGNPGYPKYHPSKGGSPTTKTGQKLVAKDKKPGGGSGGGAGGGTDDGKKPSGGGGGTVELEPGAPIPKDFAAHWNSWGGALSAAERRGVKSYTDYGFRELNDGLRGNPKPPPVPDKKLMASLDSALSKGKTPTAMVVHRGVSRDMLSKFKAGQAYVDKGYMSTSVDRGKAENFGGKSGPLLRITVPKGASGAYVEKLSVFKGEKEFLIPRGQRLNITKIETVKGRKIVHAEYAA